MIATDLIGQPVWMEQDGDSGWIRAMYLHEGKYLWALVQRDNSSYDMKSYPINEVKLRWPRTK